MFYIDELRIRVGNRFGSHVRTKPDAQRLRVTIFESQNEYLSESTIRRFFHLIPSGKISRITLDVFSRFIGFTSYLQFSEFCEKIIHFSTTNNTDAVILDGLKEKELLSMLEVNLIAHRINQCIVESNYKLLKLYFNNDKLFHLLTLSDTTHDLFAQAVGPFVENESLLIDVDQILGTAFFIPLVLNKYVDIQNKSMERYYEWMVKNSKKSIDLVFSASVLSLNSLYTGTHDRAKSFYQLIDHTVALDGPVLIGRIVLLKWVFTNDFDNVIMEAKKYETQLLFFSIDLISYLVFFDKIEALKTWFDFFPTIHITEKTWVEKEILFFYNVARLIAFGKTSDLKLILSQRISVLNSNTTIEKIYPIIEKRYLNGAYSL